MSMFKTKIEDEKAKLLADLKAFETKAKAELAELETKAKDVLDLKDEIAAVETKIKMEVQKIEKWFVTAIKGQAQTTPVVEPAPAANTAPVVEPTANTESK